jgi:hypothetical protein
MTDETPKESPLAQEKPGDSAPTTEAVKAADSKPNDTVKN